MVAWVALPLYAAWRWRRLAAAGRREVALLASAAVVLAVALVSPLHRLADSSSFLLHVVQHMLLQMVAPPLVVLGVPTQVWRQLLEHPTARRAVGLLLHPVTATTLYNGVLFFWHWPVPVGGGAYRLACGVLSDLATQSGPLRVVQDLLPAASGLLFWAALWAPAPLSQAGRPVRAAMILISMVFNWLISFSLAAREVPMYATYAGARLPFGLSPLGDQMLGAGILWEHGNMAYVLALLALVRGWLREGPPAASSPSGRALPPA